jgi:glyoxylase-like metal-dependent hydrolase (beta-lactamase superfamily II)
MCALFLRFLASASVSGAAARFANLSTSTRVEGWNYTFPPAPAGAIPTTGFDDEHRVHQNGTSIALRYYGPAHTDCDIRVVFEEADVVHVGDTWWNGIYPFIDDSTGGSIDGMTHAAELNLAAVGNETIVILGHGPIGNKTGLIEYRDMLVAIRGNVAVLKQQGKSLSETIAAKPTATYDAKWGHFLITPAMFTELVYSGI